MKMRSVLPLIILVCGGGWAAQDSGQTGKLPSGSRLLNVQGQSLHIRELGERHPGEADIVMLSGPAGHWQSDSAYFALLQPMLARHHHTLAIDRPGHGWGPLPATVAVNTAGYRHFAHLLPEALKTLQATDIIIIGFASANLSILPLLQAPEGVRVRGVLLIDPDSLDAADAEFYAAQAKDFQNPELTPYVLSGKYDERARKVKEEDEVKLKSILKNNHNQLMGWDFYHSITEEQLQRQRIAFRFAEVGLYDADVHAAASVAWPKSVPLILWDTDFESADIRNEPDNPRLPQWQKDSTDYFQQLAGCGYRHSGSEEHLATFAEPEALTAEAERLLKGLACP